jgi:hypothetical protein
MTSQGTAHGRFERAIHRGHIEAAETAAREVGGLSLLDALSLCELLAKRDPARYERAALRWLERFIDERVPPLVEVALTASALAELRHGHRAVELRHLRGCYAVAKTGVPMRLVVQALKSALVVLILACLFAVSPEAGGAASVYRIDRVVDGDTVALRNGQRVRLVQNRTSEVFFGAECYGRAASGQTK